MLRFSTGLAAYGDIACLALGPLRFYWLNNPDLIHQMLVEQADKFYKPRFLKRILGSLFGNGLLLSEGDFWKRQRKLMQPAFHLKRIEGYSQVMADLALQLMESWHDGEVRDIPREMGNLTLQVVAKTLFSAEMAGDVERLNAIRAVFEQQTNPAFGMFPKWLQPPSSRRFTRALEELDRLILNIIEKRRASDQDTGDLLSMLLLAQDEDSGDSMSAQQVRDEVMTLFLAGQDTVAAALIWTWYLLSQAPEVEAKLHEELARVLAGRLPTMQDQLPYTDMIIKETLRLYPPSGGISREAIEDISLGGYTIKKGSSVGMSTYALHHDPRYFEEPECFIPKRFAKANEDRLTRYAYLPFGGGPRICIGNMFALVEARLILATIAQRYQLTLVPGQEITPVQSTTIRPKHGLQMKLAKREH